jgi:hypothetical protein
LFEYRQSGGNTIIQIDNGIYSESTARINIYVDYKVILSDSLNKRTHPRHTTSSIKTSFGRHKLTVNSPELGFSKDYIFHSIIMKWIHISLGKDFSKASGDHNEFRIIIHASSVPLAIE